MAYAEYAGAEAVKAELEAQGFDLTRHASLQGNGINGVAPTKDFDVAAAPSGTGGPTTPQVS